MNKRVSDFEDEIVVNTLHKYPFGMFLKITSITRATVVARVYTRKNATDLLQPVAPSGLIQV